MSAPRRLPAIRARHVVLAWLVVYFPWLPGWPLNRWLPDVPFEFVVDANLAVQFSLIAISLVLLTGWVGQISLGQGAFVGIGAFVTGMLFRNWDIPFPLTLPLVALVTAGIATALGLVALRVRGLYLAVATLIFAWMCDAYLFSASWFVGSAGSSSIENRVIGHPDSVTLFDLSNERTLYLVMIAVLVATWFCLVNLRDSKTGRAFFAIRGSEMAAVSLGVDVIRYKLLAFALSGALAGIAGNLMMVDQRAVTPDLFDFTESLFFLGIAVVGGISSLGGAVAAGVLFAALDEVFFKVDFLEGWLDVVTIGLLLGVLLGYPGGLGALGAPISTAVRSVTGSAVSRWRAWRRWVREQINPPRPAPEPGETISAEGDDAPSATPVRRRSWRLPGVALGRKVVRRSIDLAAARAKVAEEREAAVAAATPPVVDWRNTDLSAFALPKRRTSRAPILEAEGITVQFGGLRAVDNVSLAVREHEIVGLIGPNGAGKTTTFNAIAGLNEPAAGTIKLFGDDVTDLPVHLRAQMGMARTFQLIQLFSQLTVFDNLLVATHVANQTGVFSHVTLTDNAIRAERAARRKVRLVVELLGLEEYLERPVAGLPFGILRQVEIARALVTGAPFLMLDEPASGLDNAETDELTRLLYYLRAEIGVSILLIEHDVRMVTSVTDYMYVLDQGRLLAEGLPADIQRNPAVIAAYLGQAASDEDADELELEPA